MSKPQASVRTTMMAALCTVALALPVLAQQTGDAPLTAREKANGKNVVDFWSEVLAAENPAAASKYYAPDIIQRQRRKDRRALGRRAQASAPPDALGRMTHDTSVSREISFSRACGRLERSCVIESEAAWRIRRLASWRGQAGASGLREPTSVTGPNSRCE